MWGFLGAPSLGASSFLPWVYLSHAPCSFSASASWSPLLSCLVLPVLLVVNLLKSSSRDPLRGLQQVMLRPQLNVLFRAQRSSRSLVQAARLPQLCLELLDPGSRPTLLDLLLGRSEAGSRGSGSVVKVTPDVIIEQQVKGHLTAHTSWSFSVFGFQAPVIQGQRSVVFCCSTTKEQQTR